MYRILQTFAACRLRPAPADSQTVITSTGLETLRNSIFCISQVLCSPSNCTALGHEQLVPLSIYWTVPDLDRPVAGTNRRRRGIERVWRWPRVGKGLEREHPTITPSGTMTKA